MQPRQSRFTPIAMLVLTVCVVIIFTTASMRSRPAQLSEFYTELVGRPTIPFTLKDLAGNEVSSSSFDGKVAVLDLWATWCPTCVEELPKISAVAAKYADKGVVFQAINVGDSADEVRAFVQQNKITIPVLLDEKYKVGIAYNAEYLPLTVIIGRDGRILAHGSLAPEETEEQLTKWIESALKSGQAS